MAVGNRYRLIDTMDFIGDQTNPLLNVYYFLQTAGVGNASNLANEWINDVLPDVRAVQSVGIVHRTIDVINMDSPADFFQVVLAANNVGLRPGDGLPVFTAWAFRYLRASMVSRHGAKRIAGLAEPDQNAGEAVGAIIPLLNALAVRLGTAIVDGLGNSWEPRIGRVAPPAPFSSFAITGVSYIRISTQNTRKR